MKVPDGQTIEECIRDDVHGVVVKTGRKPRLAYLVNWGDATNLLQRLKPDIADVEFHARDFELHTEGGRVRVMGDRNSPRGAVYRMVVCKCGGLAMYAPGVELCTACLGAQARHPYAPGEKMTDRHPDSVIAQVVEETIEEVRRRFDREYPSPINIGDRVRWWPHVTALGTPSADASYSDGVIVDRDVIRIESHGSNRWSSRDGLCGDLRSCAGALVRRLPVPVIATCPGYDAVFHIEPDPPDLAERQSARVAEHQRREAGRGPFDYDVPRYDGILKAPYERPSVAARPDGFDQHQVDAAKAAMLAPAPPRYPRRAR